MDAKKKPGIQMSHGMIQRLQQGPDSGDATAYGVNAPGLRAVSAQARRKAYQRSMLGGVRRMGAEIGRGPSVPRSMPSHQPSPAGAPPVIAPKSVSGFKEPPARRYNPYG